MATRLTTPRPKTSPRNGAGGMNGSGRGYGGGGDGESRYWGPRRPYPPNTWRVGMMLGLASISMLFIALTSAYVVRAGMSQDWRSLRMPPALVLNTAVLLTSSLTIEKARRNFAWLKLTLGLGLLFVAGQVAAWRELSAQGVYLGSNPHSSFFYLLTGLHGLHVLGGVAALAWVETAILRRHGAAPQRWLDTAALYWHFMDALWIYLLGLLFVWR